MVAFNKACFFAFFIVFGILILENEVEVKADHVYCIDECDPQAAYMICPPHNERTDGVCKNCCQIKYFPELQGCHLFSANDTLIC
ncbi:unnamed protein product [Cuscuta campestris]|uniref:Uncharacterized protein n=1 Tax=Cuscuta campestris TaxID=132261 RepID=A0A484NKE6_9ASTE|nr:unnamed protein product [Cuscuta campestris]